MQPNQGFIIDSYHYYKIAKEGFERAKEGFEIHRQYDALVSIIFSALSLEAFINEMLAIAKLEKQDGSTEDFLDKLINAIDEVNSKKNTPDKFMEVSVVLDSRFNKGNAPYQDFADLFKLRDCLVHLKPEDTFEVGDNDEIKYFGRDLTERLRSKRIFLETTSIESITLKVSTAKAASWACDTASKMVNAVLDKFPSSFSYNNKQIELYRANFQSPNNKSIFS